jgi:hypothetical protein
MNLVYLEKDAPELASMGGLWRCPAPRQSLSRDVYEAPLDHSVRPDRAKGLRHLGIAIDGEATGNQSLLLETPKVSQQLRLRTFRDTVLTGHDGVCLRIHQGNDCPGAMNERSVQDKVLAAAQVCFRHRLFQAVTEQTVQFRGAMSALAGQLPDGVAFDYPTPEPFPLIGVLRPGIMPAERSSARLAKPPLPTIGVMAVSLEVGA